MFLDLLLQPDYNQRHVCKVESLLELLSEHKKSSAGLSAYVKKTIATFAPLDAFTTTNVVCLQMDSTDRAENRSK